VGLDPRHRARLGVRRARARARPGLNQPDPAQDRASATSRDTAAAGNSTTTSRPPSGWASAVAGPAVGARHRVDDRQAEPEAAVTLVMVPLVETAEPLEEPGDRLGGDERAAVGDPQRGGVGVGPGGDGDPPGVHVVLQRVLDQVLDEAFEERARRLGPELTRGSGRGSARARRRLGQPVGDSSREVAEVHRPIAWTCRAGSGQGEEAVDERLAADRRVPHDLSHRP